MKTNEFFTKKELNNSFIAGYYGAGNFGDELLLEIILGILKSKNCQEIRFFYSSPKKYNRIHKDYGFELVDGSKKMKVLYNLLRSRNIIIGGGGLWGCDFSKNTFFLTVALFLSKLFKKNVYCVGVGYYNSTSRLGRISAFLMSKASKIIIARDKESFSNFRKFTDKVYIDKDIAFFYDLANYRAESKIEDKIGKIKENSVLIGLRRFKNSELEKKWKKVIEDSIKNNPKSKFILSIFEFKETDPQGYEFVKKMNKKYKNVMPFEFNYNPLELVSFLKKNSKRLIIISPQYHINLISYLSSVKILPISYDNKSVELFNSLGLKNIKISDKELKNKIKGFLK